MYLLLFILLFAVLGYFLASSKVGDSVDNTANQAASQYGHLTTNFRTWWHSLFHRSSLSDSFRIWVVSEGADNFPMDFRNWLVSLSVSQAQEFTQDLANYSKGLGFELKKLVTGGLDEEPLLRQVFVETIVVYSREFRKAKQIHLEVDESKKEKSPQDSSEDGKKSAEKQTSRRKEEPISEAAEISTVA